MRYIEWAVMFIVAGLGIALANFVGFQVSFVDSLPGIAILLLISLASVGISKIVPLKLPVIAYCSLLGLFLACPLSPIRDFVIESAGKINRTSDYGWCVRRNFYQRPAEGICKAGMENADYCSTCYDWNFYIFCNYCTGWLVPDWCDLREKGIVWRIF